MWATETVEEYESGSPEHPFLPGLRQLAQDHEALEQFIHTPAQNSDEQLTKELALENFPVVFGATIEGIDSTDITFPRTHITGEFMVKDGVSWNQIKVVLVPRERIELVEELLKANGRSAKVFPIEALKI